MKTGSLFACFAALVSMFGVSTSILTAAESLSQYDYGVDKRVGTYRVLLVPICYSDGPRAKMSRMEGEEMAADAARFWNEASFGQMKSVITVTEPVMLPYTLAAKNEDGGEHGVDRHQVSEALRRNGYDPVSYDCLMIRDITGGGGGVHADGVAFIGASHHAIITHEGGHNLAAWHADAQGAPQRLPYEGSANEAGGPFDVMGSNYNGGFHCHYHVENKRKIGWLTDLNLHRAVVDGVYRIYAIDQSRLEPGKRYGLQVTKDGHTSYWLEHRGLSRSLARQTPVLYNRKNQVSYLLDTTPQSYPEDAYRDFFDSGMVPGVTYSDLESDMHFTVISENATVPPSVDVVYRRGPFPGNRAPVIGQLTVNQAAVQVGDQVTFTAQAVDADGDPLAYHWDFAERSYLPGRVNEPSVAQLTRRFSTAGQVTAMLTVSDMKGGVARRHVLLDVGAASGSRVSGTVLMGGVPLMGVRISDANRPENYAFTDSNGVYVLSNTMGGNRTLQAFKTGYTFAANGFANPIQVSGNNLVANWTAALSMPEVTLEKIGDAAEGGATGGFRIRRTGATDQALVVRMARGLGNAVEQNDYTLNPAWTADAEAQYRDFTIPAGQSTLEVVVAAVNDLAVEGDEILRLQLVSAATYQTLTASAVEVTIGDNETALPAVSVAASGEGAWEGGVATIFRLVRTGNAASALIVPLNWSGTAGGADVQVLPGTVEFAAGAKQVDVWVTATDDGLVEGDENLTVTIAAGSGHVVAAGGGSATQAVNDANLPEVVVSAMDAQASESGEAGSFLVQRTGSTVAALTVYYNLTGSATEGLDYTEQSGIVTIPAGRASAPVFVQPLQDGRGEKPEVVTLTLNSAKREYRVGTANEAQVTIADDDGPSVWIEAVESDARITEGETAQFRIQANGSGSGSVVVPYTLGGTVTMTSDSLAPASGTVVVPINGSVLLSVSTVNDSVLEPTETLEAALGTGVGYTLEKQSKATLLVQDNDSGAERVNVSFSMSYWGGSAWDNDTVPAFGEKSTSGGIVFSRGGTTGDLTVKYRVVGTAVPVNDFTGLQSEGEVVIPAGSSRVKIPLTMVDDSVEEGLESFTVEVLTNAGYSVDIPSSALVEIQDDDAGVTVEFSNPVTVSSEQESALNGYVEIPLRLSAASASAVSVRVEGYGNLMGWSNRGDYSPNLEGSWEPETAIGGGVDWEFLDASQGNLPVSSVVVTFAPGQTQALLRVRLVDDALRELAERFRIRMMVASRAKISTTLGVHEVVISDAPGSALVQEERWSGTATYDADSWGNSAPGVTRYLRGFITDQGVADQYSRRLRGRVMVPFTGEYQFWIASDDQSRLYVSTTGQAADKVKIAEVGSAVTFKNWDSQSSQRSGVLNLTAGQWIDVEVQHKEGSGGDFVAVAWRGPGFERRPLTLDYMPGGRPKRVGFSAAEYRVQEGSGADADVLVVLDEPAGSTPVTVSYAVAGGSATRNEDYTLTDGTLTFGPGVQFQRLPLQILTDAIGEQPEVISLVLSSPSAGVSLSTAVSEVRIVDGNAPIVGSASFTASSSMAVGTVLGQVTATPSAGRTIQAWYLVGGNGSNAFAIHPQGQLSLTLPGVLPKPGGVRLRVRAVDSTGASGDGEVVVTCNVLGGGHVIEQRWAGTAAYDNRDWSGAPTYSGTLSQFTSAQNVGENYSRRLCGYVTPPITGDYTFRLSGDDDCRLYLSSDSSPANAMQIASVVGWTGYQAWYSQEVSQLSRRYRLEAGRVYWLEVHQRELTGNDHVSVSWQTSVAPNEEIPASAIVPFAQAYQGSAMVEPPTVAIQAPQDGAQYFSGQSVAIQAVVTGSVSGVEFFRGSQSLGVDTTAPYQAVWNSSTVGTHEFSAKVFLADGELVSRPITVQVVDPDPLADSDGDGFHTALELSVGTDPYLATSKPESHYAQLRGWWKLDESSGNLADDASGRDQDGVVTHATWVSGVFGNGLQFNGTSSKMEVPKSLLSNRASFTISGWYKTSVTSGNRVGLWGQNDVVEFGINGSNLSVWTPSGGSVSSPLPAANQWHHVACVGSGTSLAMFVDGVRVAITQVNTVSYGSSTSPFRIGGGGIWDSGGNFFNGLIDDVRVYERALSDAEIQAVRDTPIFGQSNQTLAATAGTQFQTTLSASSPGSGGPFVYEKLSGPSWLNLSPNGVASGVPGNQDRGSQSALIRVRSSSGGTAIAPLTLWVNGAPVFASDLIRLSAGVSGSAYGASIANQALDPEGDALTFTKLSGPAWLTVGATGAVQGTPLSANTGENQMVVRVSDGKGGEDIAVVVILVELPNAYGTLVGQNTNDEYIQRVRFADLDHLSGDNQGSANFLLMKASVMPGQSVSYTLTPGWTGYQYQEAWTVWVDLNRDGDFNDAGEKLLERSATASEQAGTVVIPANASQGLSRMRVAMKYSLPQTSPTGSFQYGEVEDYSIQIGPEPMLNVAPYFLKDLIQVRMPQAVPVSLAGSAADWENHALAFTKVSGPSWLSILPEGVLSGTPPGGTSGLQSFEVRVTDAFGGEDTAILEVLIDSGFSGWMSAHGLSGGLATVNADPDGDGISNGVEFVLGGDPSGPNSDSNALLPVLGGDADYLEVRYRRTSESVSYAPVIQYGSNLSSWTVAQAGVSGVTIQQESNFYGAGVDRVTVRIPRSLAVGGKLFTRLQVSVP